MIIFIISGLLVSQMFAVRNNNNNQSAQIFFMNKTGLLTVPVNFPIETRYSCINIILTSAIREATSMLAI